MAKFETHFIPQNKLPNDAYICVYQGEKLVGMVNANVLTKATVGKKLYSFGALSDVHVTYGEFAREKVVNAIKFLTDEMEVAFTCISGDLTSTGTTDQFRSYISAVETAKGQCVRNAIIHDTTGNHDVEQGNATISFLQDYADGKEPYASRPLYYSFNYGDDVFIMFGMTGWPGKNGNNILFSTESMAWLESTLNANKGKRIFLFEHCPYFTSTGGVVTDGIGVVVGLSPPTGGYISSRNHAFMQLISANPNVIFFHGHTHIPFYRQSDYSGINYSEELGVHIPSLATGRKQNDNGGWVNDNNESWGYVVDVYENHIVIRGCNFMTKKFVPIATYQVQTSR